MNIIWITSDTLRKDAVAAYGNDKMHTPSLDALAARSMRFNRHYIAAFPTMPTRADYLTGRFTMSYMQWQPLAKTDVTVSDLLSNKGIHTAAVVDTPFYTRNGMNYDRGFLTFKEVVGQYHHIWVGDEERKEGEIVHRLDGGDVRNAWRYESDYFAPKTFDTAMKWLEKHYQENFLLYIDTWDPHEPWDPPKYYTEMYWPGHDGNQARPIYGYWQDVPGYTEEMVRKAHASYCGEVTMVDTWLGYLLRHIDNLGLMENTAIIFSSDHGYYFGEHGGLMGKMVFEKDSKTGMMIGGVWTHSPFYEEVTAIPLLIYVPGAKPGVYNGLTSAVDLMPTVMDIMGQEIPSHVEGKSLLPMVKDPTTSGRNYVVSAHPFMNAGETVRSIDDVPRIAGMDSQATLTTDEWALLYSTQQGMSELYNLKSDPQQEKNMIKENPEKARELHKMLVDFMKETKVAEHVLKPRLELRI